MIFEYPDENVQIRQGDIFYPLPLLISNLNKLMIIPERDDEDSFVDSWNNIKDTDETMKTVVPIKKVWGIVASQDCDTSRSPLISFFVIDKFGIVSGLRDLPKSTKKWVSLITQTSRLNARWFYLPCDKKIGFEERMAINFHIVFQIPRVDLENYVKELRKGRLNDIAFQHYRERIAQYFRRYPYDEWYPLNREEFEEYNKEKGKIVPVKPFDWQQGVL